MDANTVRDALRGDSELESILMNRIGIAGLPFPERQFRFCSTRRWRADFAYPSARLLIEVDGGAYIGGRHTRGRGFEADCEKTSTAAALGFRVIRLTGRMVKSGVAVELIRQALEQTVELSAVRTDLDQLVGALERIGSSLMPLRDGDTLRAWARDALYARK